MNVIQELYRGGHIPVNVTREVYHTGVIITGTGKARFYYTYLKVLRKVGTHNRYLRGTYSRYV